MADLLKDYVSYKDLVTVFPAKPVRYSRDSLESKAPPCLLIKSSKRIYKSDYFLTVDQEKYDISALSVKDVVILLQKHGIEASIIEHSFLENYPALLLSNISNSEYKSKPLLTNPFSLQRVSYLDCKNIIPIELSVVVKQCFTSKGNKTYPCLVENNKLFVEGIIEDDSEVIFKVDASVFIWSLNTSNTITNNPVYVSRYLEDEDKL